MQLSRRAFLTHAIRLTAAPALAALAPFFDGLDETAVYPVGDAPALQELPTGPLDETVIANLLAMTTAIIGEWELMSHYRNFFHWRAENLPGYKAIYTYFSETVDALASEAEGRPFAELSAGSRRALLQQALRLPQPDRAVYATVVARQGVTMDATTATWLYFDTYVIGEMLKLFARTNAWIAAGYDAWPGTPRLLDTYTQPLPQT